MKFYICFFQKLIVSKLERTELRGLSYFLLNVSTVKKFLDFAEDCVKAHQFIQRFPHLQKLVFLTVIINLFAIILKIINSRFFNSTKGNSRNSSFENLVLTRTNGRGVDLVLNSLAGELFEASIRCLAFHGRFLELGKVDFFNRTLLDSNLFLKNCSFHGIVIDQLHDCPWLTTQIVQLILHGK